MNSVTYIVKQPQILYVKMEPFPLEVQPPFPLTKISADGVSCGACLGLPRAPSFFSKALLFPKASRRFFFFTLCYENWRLLVTFPWDPEFTNGRNISQIFLTLKRVLFRPHSRRKHTCPASPELVLRCRRGEGGGGSTPTLLGPSLDQGASCR